MSVLTLEAKLERTEGSTPWGFRMQGGKDFSSPLTIQRVNPGSLAAKCGLQVGDIILKIGATSTDILRHKEAQDSIIRSGNHLDLLLQRGGTGGYDKFNAPQISPGSFNAHPQPFNPSPVSPTSSTSQQLKSFNSSPKPFQSPTGPAVSPAPTSPSRDATNSSCSTNRVFTNFNSAPRPFGAPAAPPAPPAPPAPRDYNDGGLAHHTQNLSLSSQPKEAQPAAVSPSYQNAADKYSEREEPTDPSQHQSKSFKYLQNLMSEGKELNAPLKANTGRPTSPSFYNNNANANNAHNHQPGGGVHPVKAPSPTPVGPGSKPGTVKAIVSQKYNNPIGLYSKDNVSSQYQGQSKILMGKDDGGAPGDISSGSDDFPPPPPPEDAISNQGEVDSAGKKKYVPSETFRLVQEDSGLKQKDEEPGPAHSRTFKLLQQQLTSGAPISPVSAPHPVHKVAQAPAPAYQAPAYQAPPAQPSTAPKPWITNAPPAPVANATPKPFGANAGGPPPKPSGVGATRGKKGDAAMNAAPLPTGRIPVCSGCTMPIRGPFVTALGKCWCPDHFVCANAQCGVKLLDIGFVEESGFLYCEKDYAVHFAPHCDKCGRAIIGECVNAMNKSFHKDCFLCHHCNKPIGGNQFHLEEGKFYCEADWNVLFQTMCSGCDFPIEPGDAWVEALGKNFHSECFNCTYTFESSPPYGIIPRSQVKKPARKK